MTKKATIYEQEGKVGEFRVWYDDNQYGSQYVYYWYYEGESQRVRKKLRDLEHKKAVRPTSEYSENIIDEEKTELNTEEAEDMLAMFADDIENSVPEVWLIDITNG